MTNPVAPSLTGAQVREIKRQARLEVAKRAAAAGDVLTWGKALLPDRFKLPFCRPLHQHLVETRKAKFTSTEAPRGHSKSTIGSFLIPLFQGLVEPDAFRHYLAAQSNADKALVINRAIKIEIEQNPLIRTLYGNQVGTDRWTDACFVLKNGVVYSAEGCGASIRGINYRGVRPDWCCADDIYNAEEDANNPNGTIKKNDWFFSTLYPALAQDRPTSMHLTGTAVNREDLFFKLKSDPDVASKTFKAVTDWDKKTVLWEGLKTFDEFEQMRTRMGTLIFSREFQNERRDDSSSIIKTSWLYPENGAPSWEYDPSALKFDEHFSYHAGVVTLDPSIGGKKGSDKSGYAVVLRGQRDDGSLPLFFVESVVNELHSFQQRIDTVKDLIAGRSSERPITRVRVEAISGFRDVADRIAASVSIPCELIDHVPNKLTNLERKSNVFENHRVFLNREIDPALKTELTYQLVNNSPLHDDLRDAVLMGLDEVDPSWAAWV